MDFTDYIILPAWPSLAQLGSALPSYYTCEMNRICFIMNHFLLSVTFVQNLLDNFLNVVVLEISVCSPCSEQVDSNLLMFLVVWSQILNAYNIQLISLGTPTNKPPFSLQLTNKVWARKKMHSAIAFSQSSTLTFWVWLDPFGWLPKAKSSCNNHVLRAYLYW